MGSLRELWARLRGVRHGHPAETELDEELSFHRTMLVNDGLRRGLSLGEAERRAAIELGNQASISEAVRDQAGVPWLESAAQDVRFGLRLMRRNPGFTLVAVLALALGIGANTLMFSVVNGVLLRPLPYADAGRLMAIQSYDPKTSRNFGIAVPDYEALRDRTRLFSGVAALYQRPVNITGDNASDRVQEFIVSPNFFSLLGAQPVLGRLFAPGDARWGSHRVVLLTEGLWNLRYGRDPGIVGRTVALNGDSYQVIGILPAQFGTFLGMTTQLYVPMSFAPDDMMNSRNNHFLSVFGRLKDDASPAHVADELEAITATIHKDNPTQSPLSLRAVELRETLVANVKPTLWVLMGAVGFVLFIACANLANLLLARASSRSREIAVRTALGASKPRLVRQFIVESTLLSVSGGILGLLLAAWGASATQLLSQRILPRADEVHIEPHVLLFTLAVSLLTGLIFGLAPALHGLAIDLNDVLKEGTRSAGQSGPQRMRGMLVVAQVAISMVLLIGAGLMFKSTIGLLSIDPGFDPHNVISSFLNLPRQKYHDASYETTWDPRMDAKAAQYFNDAFTRVRAIPGVVAVGGISNLPLTGEAWGKVLTLYDRPLPATVRELPENQYRVVAGDYFRALGIHVRGRAFADTDTVSSQPVVVVNRTLERMFWPDGSAIGKTLSINPPASVLAPHQSGPANQDPTRFNIVGVADDVHYGTLESAPPPLVYGLLSQAAEGTIGLQLVVRTQGDPLKLAPQIREQLAQVDRDVPFANVQSLETLLSNQTALPRIELLLFGLFAGLAVVLASIGIYGVMSYAVAQRTREIGVRMALGATRSNVLVMVMKSGAILVTVGIVIGLGASFWLTRLLAAILTGVTTTDRTVFLCVTAALAVVALLAAYAPARRATRIDPMVALRNE